MISFAASQYKGSCLGYQGLVYDVICNLSVSKVMPGLPRMGNDMIRNLSILSVTPGLLRMGI